MTETNKLPGIWGDMIKAGQEDAAQGAGVVCLIKLESGYKVYAKGFDMDETFFLAPAGDTPEILEKREAVKQQAIAFVNERQAKTGKGELCKPEFGLQMIAYPDNVISGGKLTTWKGQRTWNHGAWTLFFQEKFIPAMITAGILDLPFESWCRLRFEEDPTGRTESDGQGGTRTKRYPVIDAVYSSMEDAHRENLKETATAATADQSGSSFPAGYNEKSWANVHDVIRDACHSLIKTGKSIPDAAADVAAQWSIDVKYIIPIAAEPPF